MAAILLSVGCQHTSVQQLPESANRVWLTDQRLFADSLKTRDALEQWRYSAKVAVTTAELREQANLVWQFGDQVNSVRLFGPLGAGAVKIEFDQSGVQMSDSKGLVYRGDSAEQLLEEIVGWPIPVDALAHWLFALPSPQLAYRYRLGADGELVELEQQGWLIKYGAYRDYQTAGISTRLPKKLTATRNDGYSPPTVVKLVTKQWQ